MSIELGKNHSISKEMIENFAADFQKNPLRKIVMNAIKKNGISAVAINQDSTVKMQYTFSNEIETGDITNQKQSGRCWLFAGLNTIRQQVANRCGCNSFELSQNYMMFWDKFEKANYFLESILETLNEETNSRLVSWLLRAPVQDGGQWDMFVNLVEKYGVVPKYVMPETFESSRTRTMNRLLTIKLRKDAAQLRSQYKAGQSSLEELRTQKEVLLNEVYRVLSESLGEPPTTFDFEYSDSDKEFHRDVNLTPKDFYQKYVGLNLNDFVSLIHAPTDDKPFGRTYTVKYLGNVKSGKDVLYLNITMEEFKALALKQLQNNEPVWFGCDVGQLMDRDTGIMDTSLFDYESLFDVSLQFSKADRLDYGDSQMTHAMVLIGVNIVDGKPNRWKVENSWGKEPGKDGHFIMSDTWFNEYMYQIVINKKHLPEHLRSALEQKPITLEPWDPMGSLALMKN